MTSLPGAGTSTIDRSRLQRRSTTGTRHSAKRLRAPQVRSLRPFPRPLRLIAGHLASTAIMSTVIVRPGRPTPWTINFDAAGGRVSSSISNRFMSIHRAASS